MLTTPTGLSITKPVASITNTMKYTFRRHDGRGKRWSVYAARFITDVGTTYALEWFDTYEDANQAADEMKADGRFRGISIYSRSQETANFN